MSKNQLVVRSSVANFAGSELEENSVIRDFLITASDGKSYTTKHYNLSAIIAVGSDQ